MSKSLGNGVDPIEVINEYGTDALRFSLIQNISAGNDIRYIPEKVEASRNFVNKLWNAAKFVNMYINDLGNINENNIKFMPEDKWILTKLSNVIEEVTDNIDKFEIGVAIQKIYDFVWSDFCDLYIEMVKPRLYEKSGESYLSAIWTLNYTLLSAIKLLHPYMPYVTEEIYQNLNKSCDSIMQETWPEAKFKFEVETEIVEIINDLLRQIRNTRANMDIQGSKKVNSLVLVEDESVLNVFKEAQGFIQKLGYIEEIKYINSKEEIDQNYTSLHTDKISLFLDLSSLINVDDEIAKLNKEKEDTLKELNRAKGMLSNESFVSKAPAALVEKEKQKIEKYTEVLSKIEEQLSKFSK